MNNKNTIDILDVGTTLWNISQLFLGEVVFGWDARVAVCGLLHYVFVFEFVFSGISCCETRVWLCAAACTSLVSQALSSLRLGSGRQAGAPLTTTHPAKGAAKQFYFLATANFYQSRIIGKYPRSGCPPSLRQTSDKIKFIKFLRHAAFYCLS